MLVMLLKYLIYYLIVMDTGKPIKPRMDFASPPTSRCLRFSTILDTCVNKLSPRPLDCSPQEAIRGRHITPGTKKYPIHHPWSSPWLPVYSSTGTAVRMYNRLKTQLFTNSQIKAACCLLQGLPAELLCRTCRVPEKVASRSIASCTQHSHTVPWNFKH